MALSYDAHRILDSLRAAAPVPRPDFADLESELHAFQRRSPDSIAALQSDWMQTRRTVAQMADSLNAAGRDASGYSDAYGRFRDAYDRLARSEAPLEGQMRRAFSGDRDLAERAAAAADSMRRWEQEAFGPFAVLTADLEEVHALTDSAGRAELMLRPGAWWLVARRAHQENPFLEYSWSVPMTATRLVPVQVPLSDQNVTLRWRR